jgi:hypothetical protein
MAINMLTAADGDQQVGGSMAYSRDESRTRRNHGAMQFFLNEISAEQTINRIRRPSFILDLSLVRLRPTIQPADDKGISTLPGSRSTYCE